MGNKTDDQLRQQAESYCEGCLHFKDGECQVLKELFHLWNEPGSECWAREEDPRIWLKTLDDIKNYYILHGRMDGAGIQQIQEDSLEARTLAERITDIEIMEAYKEDLKRGERTGGGDGIKAGDGGPFGPQQMKDNRFIHRKRNPRKYNEWWQR
mgnify:CR=1 FL=1